MVNQQFTFALHIMACLAFAGEWMDSRALAASVNTNPVVVRRLLAALRRAGLIETVTGKNGGARLLRAPSRISLLKIYDAIEPRAVLAINERKASRRCQVSCNMKRVMTSISEEADEALRRYLRGRTLQNVVRQVSR